MVHCRFQDVTECDVMSDRSLSPRARPGRCCAREGVWGSAKEGRPEAAGLVDPGGARRMRAGVGSGPPLGKSVASAGLNAGEVCLEEVASELGLPVGTCQKG